ncbi:hypothetical protein DsansV1_C29g0213751 [Dioscorea sansibarensis]
MSFSPSSTHVRMVEFCVMKTWSEVLHAYCVLRHRYSAVYRGTKSGKPDLGRDTLSIG